MKSISATGQKEGLTIADKTKMNGDQVNLRSAQTREGEAFDELVLFHVKCVSDAGGKRLNVTPHISREHIFGAHCYANSASSPDSGGNC